MRSRYRVAVTLATLIALTVGAAACGGDDQASQPATSGPTTPTGPTSTQPNILPAPDETVIEVAVANGRVSPSPDRRVEVAQGNNVRIVVTSDRADEVHVHGYDQEAEIPAGGSATLEFVADQPGSFEVEMHELDPGLLFTLLVR
ncbi:MAG TPA: cupredoxin domain-containing protein [Actinomycetes bacterium]|nr:cupredoxin domain-containing protein [Actinomycetes bacterium]